jgi:hypothetical protein
VVRVDLNCRFAALMPMPFSLQPGEMWIGERRDWYHKGMWRNKLGLYSNRIARSSYALAEREDTAEPPGCERALLDQGFVYNTSMPNDPGRGVFGWDEWADHHPCLREPMWNRKTRCAADVGWDSYFNAH